MKFNLISFLTSGILFLSTPIFAQKPFEGGTAVAGVGTATCAFYVDQRRSNSKVANDAFTHYLQGFFSGQNLERLSKGLSTTDIPKHDVLLLWLESNCLKNPTSDIFSQLILISFDLIAKIK